MPVQKVCPVVLRDTSEGRQLLAFRHPLAGTQVVKATLEAGETVEAGALRELREEAGVDGVAHTARGWTSDRIIEGQLWHFVPVETSVLEDHFRFFTQDEGGLWFEFFWWDLQREPGDDWHPIFVKALAEVRLRLG